MVAYILCSVSDSPAGTADSLVGEDLGGSAKFEGLARVDVHPAGHPLHLVGTEAQQAGSLAKILVPEAVRVLLQP